MSILLQGILLGSLYALASQGLSIVFGVLKLVNLAHGAILVAGAILTSMFLSQHGGNPFVVIVLVSLAIAVIAYFVQAYLLSPIMKRLSEATIPATFAIAIAIQSLLLYGFGSDPRIINTFFSTSNIVIFGNSLRVSLLVSLALAIFITIAISLTLNRTRFGAEVQAAAADPVAAGLNGINVRHTYGLVFAGAAAISAIAGSIIDITFAIDPTSGLGWMVRSFTVVVLGGLGSIYGTLIGGILLGVIEAFGASIVGPQYRDLVVFGIFVLVLVIRPEGLASLFANIKVPERFRKSVKNEK
jgi:branched-chain amino acid transport system permease protein